MTHGFWYYYKLARQYGLGVFKSIVWGFAESHDYKYYAKHCGHRDMRWFDKGVRYNLLQISKDKTMEVKKRGWH